MGRVEAKDEFVVDLYAVASEWVLFIVGDRLLHDSDRGEDGNQAHYVLRDQPGQRGGVAEECASERRE